MKVLISAYTGLGNFILKTPAIRKIKELYPSARIDVIAGNEYGAEFVLENTNLADNIYVLKQNSSLLQKCKFFIRLRRVHYDAIFLPFDAQRKFLFFGSYVSGIKYRIVHLRIDDLVKGLFFNLSPKTICVPLLFSRHEIDLNYDLLEAYIKAPLKREYETTLGVTYSKEILNKFKLDAKKYIVLQVGAANGAKSAKKWPIERFVELIQLLNGSFSEYQVVVVGDKGDYQNDIRLLENKGLRYVNTAGFTTINEVANILNYSSIVLAHDSGIMHMANALKCNLIALYGPTDYTRTRPLGNNVHMFYSKTDCFAKMYYFSGSEAELLDEYPNCMDGISVESIYTKIRELLVAQ